MSTVLKYKPEPKEGYKYKQVDCHKCFGTKFYSSKMGQTACEECSNGKVWLETKTRKPKVVISIPVVKKLERSSALMFVRWNVWNRVCFAVFYFENGKYVYSIIDKKLCTSVVRKFIKGVSPSFVYSYATGTAKYKPTEEQWNHDASQQNGIIKMEKCNGYILTEKMNEKTWMQQYAQLYLRTKIK